MRRSLKGRTFVITGASSGIGAATAVEAGRAGMRVVLAARRVDKLEAVAALVREAGGASGGEALVVETDLSDDASVDALFDAAVARFGRVDALFANAGYGYMHHASMDGQPEDERRLWDVNYHATVRCCRAAASIMKRQGDGASASGGGGGSILICSSIVGRIGLPYYAAYAATKAAQHAFAASLRHELHPDGIHVSCVYPVGTRTEFFEVSAALRGADGVSANTPQIFMQSAQHVARRVIRCLRRPRPEVWPSMVGRLSTVLLTVFPRLGDIGLRGHTRGCRQMLADLARGHSDGDGDGDDTER